MKRIAAVALLSCLLSVACSAQDGDAQGQGLLGMIPNGAIAAVHLNFDPTTPSMTMLKSGNADALVAPEDLYEALSRLASLAGMSVDLKADLVEVLGPRIVIAISPPAKDTPVPTVTVLAQAKDPKRAVEAISRIVRCAARNDSEEAVPKGNSLVHVLRAPDGKVHFAYATMPDLVVASTRQESAADVLEGRVQGKDSPLAKRLAEMTDSLAAFCVQAPRDSGAPSPGVMPSLLSGSLSASAEGFQLDLKASFEDENPEAIPAVLASLPPVKGEALKAVPPGSLAVVAVGSPGAIVEMGKRLEGLPKVGKQVAQMSQMLSPIAGLLRNDAVFALRSLVPKPSWVAVVAGQDEAEFVQQVNQ
ncbi:MAG: hypothetical protein ACUVTZ_10910, partial [Armatimonadota bacterium]